MEEQDYSALVEMVSVRVTIDQLSTDFHIALNATILQVKQKIEKSLTYKVEMQSLSCSGQKLEDDRSLESYGFKQFLKLDLEFVRPNSAKFNIVLKFSDKESVLQVRATTAVASLRGKIERKWGIVYSYLILTHKNEAMSDKFSLAHYGVVENSEIEVVVMQVEAR
ncbi:hypothetical protein JCGZ_18431 [Jatropha curcas]|uniref:Ubiquitin-like domain-containing protein n=1 Tax=Jatropha curcas TaxID=180498 RepID=A0A067K0V8_JATCU|nr:hypothetical protein JCGZ_18430 [Jatropha curcas]KDP29856.1 hypothetical protein JCGZ_18431 [Jatropha curcas]